MNSMKDFNLFDEALVAVRIEDNAAVVTVLCSSVRERQAAVLMTTLQDVANANSGRVLLDLCGVGNLSAACITNLLAVQDCCASLGGKFVVFGLVGDLAASLRGSGVLKQLNLATDETTARLLLAGRKPRSGLFGLFRRQAA